MLTELFARVSEYNRPLKLVTQFITPVYMYISARIIIPLIILSRMRGLRDEYNGFWIGWSDLFALLHNYSQLWQFTINDCVRLAPFLTDLRVSSLTTVSDLVLVYESVTSSASVVRWLTLHSWTLNCWTVSWILLLLKYWTPLRMPNYWTLLNRTNFQATRI
jgi:hypothetical protein